MSFGLSQRIRWRSLRWLGLLLVGVFATVGLSLGPVNAQQIKAEDAFCTVSSGPLANPVQGRSYGDPHIQTYDGLSYAFHLLGEFDLTQTQSGNFKVQARQKRLASNNNVSLNSAVAMQVCGHRVAIYAQDIPDRGNTATWIDGVPTSVSEATALPGGGEIQRVHNDEYAVIWPSGDQVIVRFITVGGDRFVNIMPTLSRAHRNTLIGLLGDYNGDPNNDLRGRDGTTVPPESSYSLATNALDRALPAVIPVRQVEDAYFDRLYRQFGDSWRITQADSLFDYRPGESTVTFTDRTFPSTFVTLNRVAPARVQSALDTCRNAGVAEALLDGCVFDVATTGDSGFAAAASRAIADAVVRELTDRVIDEVIDALPIPRFPF